LHGSENHIIALVGIMLLPNGGDYFFLIKVPENGYCCYKQHENRKCDGHTTSDDGARPCFFLGIVIVLEK